MVQWRRCSASSPSDGRIAGESALKENEIQQILDISAAPNTTWKEDPAVQGDKKWKRSDGQVEAFFPARQTYLVVQDVRWVPTE